MSEPSSEWIGKAEADLAAAQVLMRQRSRLLVDQVCFLSQQSVEKYLKAFLAAHHVDIPRIHNLMQLNDLCAAIDQEFGSLDEDLAQLELHAVEIRHPRTSASVADARAAFAVARKVHRFVKHKLNACAHGTRA